MTYQDDVATLSINSTSKDTAGVYRCVASNDAGDDEVEAQVTVKGV